MFRLLLLIGIGGFTGSILRFVIQQATDRFFTTSLPVGIFLINIMGSLMIGVIFGLALEKNVLSDEMRVMLATGFCGGFTTFSAFSFDNLKLLQNSEYMHLILYSGGSVLLGILATFTGILIVKFI
jgi:fluoride exporter